MLTAKQVAEYILSLSDPEEGDLISHLKLQKLLYYAQGVHLAIYDKPLFQENIYAWKLGPVVEEIYYAYKEYGSDCIPPPEDIDFSVYSDDVKELLKEVYTVYGQFSAWRLSQMTHDEPPWNTTPCDSIISHEKLKEYFRTQLIDA